MMTNKVVDRSVVLKIIMTCLGHISDKEEQVSESTAIYDYSIPGGKKLDSLSLVTLIVDIEQKLEDDYEVVLILADDKAMSQKRSPFRSVRTLADYICQLMEESHV